MPYTHDNQATGFVYFFTVILMHYLLTTFHFKAIELPSVTTLRYDWLCVFSNYELFGYKIVQNGQYLGRKCMAHRSRRLNIFSYVNVLIK